MEALIGDIDDEGESGAENKCVQEEEGAVKCGGSAATAINETKPEAIDDIALFKEDSFKTLTSDHENYKTDDQKMPASPYPNFGGQNLCFSQESASGMSNSSERHDVQNFPFTQIAMDELDSEMDGLHKDLERIHSEPKFSPQKKIEEHENLSYFNNKSLCPATLHQNCQYC